LRNAIARRLLDRLVERGYGLFTGVPCSLLAGIFAELERDERVRYVSATREDLAVGMAAGAWLGGQRAVVLMQNSGLGVCLNALASLHEPYEIPALLVVSWRGRGPDAPEHVRMGRITTSLLDALEIPWAIADADPCEPIDELEACGAAARRPAALLVGGGLLG
jgi:phosphonopyruvate decarboxylase